MKLVKYRISILPIRNICLHGNNAYLAEIPVAPISYMIIKNRNGNTVNLLATSHFYAPDKFTRIKKKNAIFNAF